jgi:preprotein translocase subunit Sss1
MGLFRRRQPGLALAGMTAATTTHHRQKRGTIIVDMTRRPTFSQWIKVTWPDLVTMVFMGIIGLGVYAAPPAPSRSFPVYFQDGQIVYPQFAYPLRKEIVPICMFILYKSYCQTKDN